MSLNAERFFSEAQHILTRVKNEQMKNIKKAAAIMADSIARDGVVHIYGPGHSKSFALELSHRAGGLVPMNSILLDDLVFSGCMTPGDLKKPMTERKAKNGLELWKLHNIWPQDALIICSNSGINGSVIEIALNCKRKEMPLIAVTSLAHSTVSKSRHPSGIRLFEVADVVIDNCCPYGDALLSTPHIPVKICGGSSIAGMFIAQALNAETMQLLIEAGYTPPVYLSQNIEGADERNEELRKKYTGRIS